MIDKEMLGLIVENTNLYAASEFKLKQTKSDLDKHIVSDLVNLSDILAYIGVQFARGVFQKGVAVKQLWCQNYGMPVFHKLMSRNKFINIKKYVIY